MYETLQANFVIQRILWISHVAIVAGSYFNSCWHIRRLRMERSFQWCKNCVCGWTGFVATNSEIKRFLHTAYAEVYCEKNQTLHYKSVRQITVTKTNSWTESKKWLLTTFWSRQPQNAEKAQNRFRRGAKSHETSLITLSLLESTAVCSVQVLPVSSSNLCGYKRNASTN